MLKSRLLAGATAPAMALLLSACVVSQSKYDAVVAENQQLTQQNQQLTQENQQLHTQLTALQQETKYVEAGDLLFPSGGWQLSPAGKADLDKLVPKLTSLSNAKVVVYGYTDNAPIGKDLLRQGITNNLDLSSRRAGAVVTYFASQGVDPSIMSAKGRGETHPVAPNDTPENMAKNRRIEIVLTGPGAS
jgi:chemotaxis protein MotB